ncbi:hypothetical protein E2C01_102477 [Portunus trituberculatus]|uniref:Uncharacterized protein n=1 Tax=Portunus trituberculatus TaxID=210409 RepID=A0A5B7KIG0_PORTR|nr:hypothetical protein [Portunus trituberculatus]
MSAGIPEAAVTERSPPARLLPAAASHRAPGQMAPVRRLTRGRYSPSDISQEKWKSSMIHYLD